MGRKAHLCIARSCQKVLERLQKEAEVRSHARQQRETIGPTLNQMSCLSFVGAVNFISRWGVETITLYW